MSDEFDRKREVIKKQYAYLKTETLKELLEDKNSYVNTFFVPKRARWNERWVDENGQQVLPYCTPGSAIVESYLYGVKPHQKY